MLIHVTPQYGFGWTDGVHTLNEPDAFDVEIGEWDSESPAGVVSTPGHDLAGYHFSASPRHVERDDIYNCTLSPGLSSSAKPTLQGYCSIRSPEAAKRVPGWFKLWSALSFVTTFIFVIFAPFWGLTSLSGPIVAPSSEIIALAGMSLLAFGPTVYWLGSLTLAMLRKIAKV